MVFPRGARQHVRWTNGRAYCVNNVGALTDTSLVRVPKMQQVAAAGIRYIGIGANYSTLQTSAGGAGGPVDVTGLRGYLDDALTCGLRVIVQIALHFSPSWFSGTVEPYKKQDGTTWAGTGANGDQVRNWPWSQAGRDLIADLFTKLAATGIAYHPAIAGAKMGVGFSGESQYAPITTTGSLPNEWWLYGASCQAGTGIATGQVVCPNPGRTPVWDGTNDAADNTIATWWLNGLTNATLWLIGQHKTAGFGGPGQDLWVMHPSTGLRDRATIARNLTAFTVGGTSRVGGGDPIGGNGPPQPLTASQIQEIARGVDPEALAAGYAPLGNVWPWSTWGNYTSTTATETGMSSVAKVIQVATKYELLAKMAVENTGSETNSGANASSMDGCFAEFMGTAQDAPGGRPWLFNWQQYTDLISGDPNYNASPSGSKATLTYYRGLVAANR